jgi:crotonobetainyl-CoA:carnitine CoA-transferase CaiB-like acyl-CoA transferase
MNYNTTHSPASGLCSSSFFSMLSGGMMLAMGVLLAAMERMKSGKGQVIDVAMTEGANYVALPL